MSKFIDRLTDQQLEQAISKEKPWKLFDGGGLYAMVMPTGSKSWRMKFRDERGKEMTLTFGCYPEVSLELARYRCSVARQMLKAGLDPRKQFDRAHIRSPIRVRSRRLLPALINKKKINIHAGYVGQDSVETMSALIFPAIQRLSASGVQQSDMPSILESVLTERSSEVVELLYDICAEVVQRFLDAGVEEEALTIAMTDSRVSRRRKN